MVPTRALASQVFDVASRYGKKLGIKVGEAHASSLIDNDVNILICTPGRFSAVLPCLNLANLRYLVIDECDRLVTDDRQNWLTSLNNTVLQHSRSVGVNRLQPGKHWSADDFTSSFLPLQRLLFSATFSANPTWLIPLFLVNPKLFSVEPPKSVKPHFIGKGESEDAPTGAPLPANLTEYCVECSSNSLKTLVLIKLLLSEEFNNGEKVPKPLLIFTNSSRNATRLTILLNSLEKSGEKLIKAACFSSRCTPNKLRQLSKQLCERKLDL